MDSITIALCGGIYGADGSVAIETWGHEKVAWFGTFLALPGGIPSHDTSGWVFPRNPEEFRRCFPKWVRDGLGDPADQVAAIDGKTLRRSHDRGIAKESLPLVSAWATASGLVVGQVANDTDSNEITAMPVLLRLLALDGSSATIDGMGCSSSRAPTPARTTTRSGAIGPSGPSPMPTRPPARPCC